jgi:hypothetical protein
MRAAARSTQIWRLLFCVLDSAAQEGFLPRHPAECLLANHITAGEALALVLFVWDHRPLEPNRSPQHVGQRAETEREQVYERAH